MFRSVLVAFVFFVGAVVPVIAQEVHQGRGVVHGVVISAQTGEPIRKARVILYDIQGTEARYRTRTKSSGEFTFRDIPAGRYRVVVSREGFSAQNAYVGANGRLRTAITVGAVQPVSLKFRLHPAGVIIGRVLDEDGDPVPDASVQAIREDGSSLQGCMTNDIGEFRLGGLERGKYLLRADAAQPSWRFRGHRLQFFQDAPDPEQADAFVPTYHPSVLSRHSATRFDLRAGQELRAEIQLLRAPAVSIRGRVVAAPEELENYSVDLFSLEGGTDFNTTEFDQTDGSFEFRRVPAGRYLLVAYISPHVNSELELRSAAQYIEVRAADVNQLILTPIPVARLRGRVEFAGGIPPSGQSQITLQCVDGALCVGFRASEIGDDGSFTIDVVLPGEYQVAIEQFGQDADYYVKSAQLGGKDVLEKGIRIEAGAAYSGLSVVVARATSSIHGLVADDNGAGQGGVSVILVSDCPTTAKRHTQSIIPADDSGRFELKALPAGKYRIAAVEFRDDSDADDTALLEQIRKRGAPLTIADGERLHLTLRLFSAQIIVP